MKKSKFTSVLCLLLALLFMGSAVCVPVAAAEDDGQQHKDIQSDLDLSEMEAYLKADSYSAYIAGHQNVGPGSATAYVQDLGATVDFPDPTIGKDNVRFSAEDMTSGDILSPSIDSLAAWQSVVGTGKDDDYRQYEGAHSGASASPNRTIVLLPKEGIATWEIDVPSTGMY